MQYRKDIDGLRAIAVVAVILFHLGFLPHGYLGVDVFFVISGYLITSIVYHEAQKGGFSMLKFYERRLRRIIPLLLFISGIALLLGLYFMLPDDLENLSQSVVASNLSANNILMLITSADYWAVKNEYKPLMHTWSLGIEEQFYLLYPFLFLGLTGKRVPYIKYALLLLIAISFTLWLMSSSDAHKFFLIQYRFFELAVGGFCAIHFQLSNAPKPWQRHLLYAALAALVAAMAFQAGTNDTKVLLTTLLTAGILVMGKHWVNNEKIYTGILTNRVMAYIGLISYSLYMWHHLVFAFARYAFLDEITAPNAILLIALVTLLSTVTYYTVENVFRDRKKVSGRMLVVSLSTLFIIITSAAFYLYLIGGVYKDFPVLSLYKKDNQKRGLNFFSARENVHNHYNETARQYDTSFTNTTKRKVLIIGDSFGRDIVNIFKESATSAQMEIRYIEIKRILKDKHYAARIEAADVVVIAVNGAFARSRVSELEAFQQVHIAPEKLWIAGVKDFGYSNGIHYNRMRSSGIDNFAAYHAGMKKGMWETNRALAKEWGSQYIDLIGPIANKQGEVLVFTPEGKLISQDTNHLTRDGAIFFAQKLEKILLKLVQG